MHGPMDDVYSRIARNRIVEIKVLDKSDIALSIIRSMPETRDVQTQNGRITVELDADENRTAELLEQLLREGVRMHSFADKEPTLEDVFMLVTKGLVS
jgi:ABC-2 type transport system ATP-binding protein